VDERLLRGEDLVGQVIGGKYEILRILGRGGMGAVYQARNLAMDSLAAIKVLRREAAEDLEAIERFYREARASSRLHHVNTIRIFDFGQAEDGRLYLVMEYLEGQSLWKEMRACGPMSPDRVLRIAEQVLKSLGEAHAMDPPIVHRDIKPENVFLVRMRGETDFVKVLDFGIAKSSGDPSLTRGAIGTPKYMSPEQAEGRRIDARSDLYSLGVMIYEMLAGRPPFQSDTPMRLLLMHMHEPPPPLRQCCPEVPREVEGLVMALLEKDPGRRPASADDVLARIAAIRSLGAPSRVPADPVSVEEPTVPVGQGSRDGAPGPVSGAGTLPDAPDPSPTPPKPAPAPEPPVPRTDREVAAAPYRPKRPWKILAGAGVLVLAGVLAVAIWNRGERSGDPAVGAPVHTPAAAEAPAAPAPDPAPPPAAARTRSAPGHGPGPGRRVPRRLPSGPGRLLPEGRPAGPDRDAGPLRHRGPGGHDGGIRPVRGREGLPPRRQGPGMHLAEERPRVPPDQLRVPRGRPGLLRLEGLAAPHGNGVGGRRPGTRGPDLALDRRGALLRPDGDGRCQRPGVRDRRAAAGGVEAEGRVVVPGPGPGRQRPGVGGGRLRGLPGRPGGPGPVGIRQPGRQLADGAPDLPSGLRTQCGRRRHPGAGPGLPLRGVAVRPGQDR